jgi:hypothetical protein
MENFPPKQMNSSQEALVILQEEAAEVIQVCSKIMRFGWNNLWLGETNQYRLTQECGDLMCMIDILVQSGRIDLVKLNEAKEHKREKLKIWSNL